MLARIARILRVDEDVSVEGDRQLLHEWKKYTAFVYFARPGKGRADFRGEPALESM